MRDERIDVGGIQLQVREYEGAGEAVVFLHYSTGNLMMWQGVVPYFEGAYRLVMPDLRGHGHSDKPPSGYRIQDMAGDVFALMQALGIERAHVVGSSMGAEVGLNLAANHPQAVASLVCEGALYSAFGPYGMRQASAAAWEEVTLELAQMRQTPEPRFDSHEAALQASRQSYEARGWWNEYVQAAEVYDICAAEDGSYTYCCRKWARDEYMGHYYSHRFEDDYRRVCCPVLMLPAESEMQDTRIVEAMQGLSQLVQDCRIEPLEGAVHAYGWVLAPEVYSQAVLQFLAGLRPSTGTQGTGGGGAGGRALRMALRAPGTPFYRRASR